MSDLLLCFIVLGLGLLQRCMATVYMVGDNAGWDISTDLNSWAAGKSFAVGDVLWFQYSSLHSVSEVSRDAYDDCIATNAIQSSSAGNTSIALSTPGPKYFICGTMSHCLGGMKLQVNVDGSRAGSPAAAPLAPGPSKQVPGSIPPGSENINKPSVPAGSSAGFLSSAKDSLSAACLCVLGAIFWMVTI